MDVQIDEIAIGRAAHHATLRMGIGLVVVGEEVDEWSLAVGHFRVVLLVVIGNGLGSLGCLVAVEELLVERQDQLAMDLFGLQVPWLLKGRAE